MKARKIKKKLRERKKEKMNIFLRTGFKDELEKQNKEEGKEDDVTESEDEVNENGEVVVPGWKKTRLKFIRRVSFFFLKKIF